MKVVVVQTVALNGGDAAILFGLKRTLERAYGRVELTVFDTQPQVARRLYPEIDFRRLLWHHKRTALGRAAVLRAAELVAQGRHTAARAFVGAETVRDLAAYAQADLVIWTGGTYLVEHYDLEPRFFELRLLDAFEAPLALFTQSAGPFGKERNRARIRDLGARAQLILARDERTRQHFVDAGVPAARVQVAADGAFALERPSVSSRGGVVVSVRAWPHAADDAARERYELGHARAVARLCQERDVQVTFLSTCQGVPEYWTNDAETARSIVARIPEPLRRRVIIDERFHSPAALLDLYGGADLVVATRMHAAILALVAGVPVLPVAYEFKTRELFRNFGQAELVQAYEEVEPESFAQWALDGYDAREALRGEQQVGTHELRAGAERLAQRFMELEVRR